MSHVLGRPRCGGRLVAEFPASVSGACSQHLLSPALFEVEAPCFPLSPRPCLLLRPRFVAAASWLQPLFRSLPSQWALVAVAHQSSGNVRVGALPSRWPRGASLRPVLRPARSPPSPPAGAGGPWGAASQGVSASPRLWGEVKDTAPVCPRTVSSLPWRSSHACLLHRCGGSTPSRPPGADPVRSAPRAHGWLVESGGNTSPEHGAQPRGDTAGFHVPEEGRSSGPAFRHAGEAPTAGGQPTGCLGKSRPSPGVEGVSSAGSSWPLPGAGSLGQEPWGRSPARCWLCRGRVPFGWWRPGRRDMLLPR